MHGVLLNTIEHTSGRFSNIEKAIDIVQHMHTLRCVASRATHELCVCKTQRNRLRCFKTIATTSHEFNTTNTLFFQSMHNPRVCCTTHKQHNATTHARFCKTHAPASSFSDNCNTTYNSFCKPRNTFELSNMHRHQRAFCKEERNTQSMFQTLQTHTSVGFANKTQHDVFLGNTQHTSVLHNTHIALF